MSLEVQHSSFANQRCYVRRAINPLICAVEVVVGQHQCSANLGHGIIEFFPLSSASFQFSSAYCIGGNLMSSNFVSIAIFA